MSKISTTAPQPTSRDSARAGFTLVELLMVVGMISMLAAILVPVVGQSRRSADSIACASNLRQVSLAMGTYETLFGSYPLLRDPTLGSVSPSFALTTTMSKTWVDQLVELRMLPSVDLTRGELGVLRCPSAKDFDSDATWLGYMPHYGYNLYINPPVADQPAIGDRSFQGRRSNMRRDASTKILLAESKHLSARRGWHGVAHFSWIDTRHAAGRGANVAFLAGNVELVRPAASIPRAADNPAYPFNEAAFIRRRS